MSSPLKAVRIVGPDQKKHFGFAFNDGFAEQDGCLIIGDGKTDVIEEEIRIKLKDRIDKNTQIHILAHGTVDKNKNHLTEITKVSHTSHILRLLDSFTPEPVQIYMDSCRGGAANKDINALKQGSVLVTSCSPDDLSYNSPFNNPTLARDIAEADLPWPTRTLKRMTKSAPMFVQSTFNMFLGQRKDTPKQDAVSPEEMFMHSLRHASQTQTFNKRLADSNFRFTYRPFEKRVVMQDGTVENFVDWSEAEFMRDCLNTKSCTFEEFSHAMPTKMTEEQTKSAMIQHVCYLITIKKISPEEIQEFFQKNNLKPDLSDKKGWRPMDYAVLSGNQAAMEGLLAAGANPNAYNDKGWTSMCYAARYDNEKAVHLLKQAGAAPTLPNKFGDTPVQIAKKYNSEAALVEITKTENTVPHTKSFVERLKQRSDYTTKADSFTESHKKQAEVIKTGPKKV